MNDAIDYNLTSDEEGAFKELKERLCNEFEKNAENDFRIYRFLKDQKFDVNQAVTAINKHLKFREEMKMDTILEDCKQEEPLLSYFPLNILGLDKEGDIVIFLDFGNCDILGIQKSVKKEDGIKHILCFSEGMQKQLFEQTQKLERPAEVIIIVDFNNLSFINIASKIIAETATEVLMMLEPNFPELLKVAYIINAPSYFSYIFAGLKKILRGDTIQKINICGRDGWLPEILKYVGPEIFPAYLGGERRDPDGNPGCYATLKRGKRVPKHYYFNNGEDHLCNRPDVEKHSLGSRSKLNIPHKVDISGSFIDWQFESENHDIGFGLFFKTEEEEDPKKLIPIERVKANLQREVGTFMCEEPGIYIIVLDNSYSWLRGKHIYIKSTVRQPVDLQKTEC